MILDALSKAGAAVLGYVTRRAELRAEAAARAHELRAKAAEQAAAIAAENGRALRAWEVAALENAGWKDEWFTVLLSVPLILAFIPGAAPYISAGFGALEVCPDWYKVGVGSAIAAAFGVRPAVDFFLTRWR